MHGMENVKFVSAQQGKQLYHSITSKKLCVKQMQTKLTIV
jgi:hypothetical protein